MKNLFTAIFTFSLTILSSAQSDSIVVENIVNFYVYNDENYPNTDAINFILKVTNNSEKPIPDLGATSRSQYVNFFINGKIDNPLSLFNGTESVYGDKTIAIGESQTFDSGWILSKNSGIIQKYGYEFTVQWEYMNVKTKIVKVNLKNKTIENVK